jgi:hypothetical protein
MLGGIPFDVRPILKKGSLEWAKISIGAQILIGGEITVDLSEEAQFLMNLFSGENDCVQ